MTENLRVQFENLSREEPNYHGLRNRLLTLIQDTEPKPPEESKLIDHARKAEGLNALGLPDGFSGKMRDLKVMLAELDQQINEKTGKESTLSNGVFDNIFNEIKKNINQ